MFQLRHQSTHATAAQSLGQMHCKLCRSPAADGMDVLPRSVGWRLATRPRLGCEFAMVAGMLGLELRVIMDRANRVGIAFAASVQAAFLCKSGVIYHH
ncbi:hypothetical protein [Tuwongella immobilis]|uniref:hypothetical protein n=1 Tax=Tuwongella immobilis TaxID=692036 RepID=UPI0013A6E492|nr:hypothetical protein [Tuwongella immobilis]